MSAVMDVSLIFSSCEILIYRVSQVALHEASGRRHDVARDGSDGTPGTTDRGCLFVTVCECDHGESTEKEAFT